jgi:hypothetical protein
MIMQRGIAVIGYVILLVVVIGCTQSREQAYRRLEERELASGVRYDSLFKGLYFGMPYESFRDHCMTMHRKGLFHEGGLRSGAWVECKLENEMKYPASLNFYPEFEERAITQMRAAVYYNNDVTFKDHPFVKDSLLHDAIRLMERWYGRGFVQIDSPDSLRDDVYVKVNGNRRITVYTDDSDNMVNLWFVDLTKKK